MTTDLGWAKEKSEEAFLPPDHLFVLLRKYIWMLTINQREWKAFQDFLCSHKLVAPILDSRGLSSSH